METRSETVATETAPELPARRRREVFRWLWHWFLEFPLLFAALVLLLLPLWGAFRSVGAPLLFWHDSLWTQLQAGIGVALFASQLTIVGYLLESHDEKWRQRHPDSKRTRRCIYVPLICLLLMPYLAPANWSKFGYPLGVAVGTALIVIIGRCVDRLADSRVGGFLRPPLEERPSWLPSQRSVGLDHAASHRRQTLYVAAFFLGYLLLSGAIWLWPDVNVAAATSVCILLSIVVAAYGFVRYRWPRRTILAYTAAFVAFGAIYSFYFAFLHRIPELAHLYSQPAALAAYDSGSGHPELLDDETVFAAWHDHVHSQRKPLLAVVATSGGGIRAAAWTAATLDHLEGELAAKEWYEGPGFPYHIRLVTGASGGMVGAAFYVASLTPPSRAASGDYHGGIDVFEIVSADSLSRLLTHAVSLFSDRGSGLQHSWEARAGGVIATPFRALATKERAGWLPSLVYTPAMVEDGRRLFCSNLDLGMLTRTDSRALASGEPETHALTGIELFKVFEGADGVKLSTVARMSASFPYVSPAVQLPTEPPRRAVDAGYYDTFGVNVAARWIQKNATWLRQNVGGVVLIQIRDATGQRRDVATKKGFLARAYSAIIAPVEGALEARTATAGFRNDEQVGRLRVEFSGTGHANFPFFTTVVFEFREQASLSWYLSGAEKNRLKDDIETAPTNQAAAAWLLKWWRGRTETQ